MRLPFRIRTAEARRPCPFRLPLALALSFAGCSHTVPPPDLVIVSVDTTRADHLGIYGAGRATDLEVTEPGSPRWLSAQGTTWDWCWAPAGKTIPSLGSLWTGKEPLEHGALAHVTALQGRSFAEELRDRGYRCFARCANASVLPDLGFARGFEDYALRPKEREDQVGPELLALAAPVVKAREPLLLWAHFMAPHQPYTPPPEDDLYGSGPGPTGDNATLKSLNLDPSLATPEVVSHLRGLYDGEIHRSSRMVRDFLLGLDRAYREAGRGTLLENAVVVYTADHGEELAERHGYFMHAKSLFASVTHVPLVIAGPGFAMGRRIADPVSLEDVIPLALHRDPPARRIFVSVWQRDFYALRDSRWTLIHRASDRYPLGPPEPPLRGAFPYPRFALYDRREDPGERHDLAAARPEILARLLGELNDWFDGLRIADPLPMSGVDPQMLESLGYAEGFEDDRTRPWSVDRWRREFSPR